MKATDRKYKYHLNLIFQYILTEHGVNKLLSVLQYQQLTTPQIELANISCRVAKSNVMLRNIHLVSYNTEEKFRSFNVA